MLGLHRSTQREIPRSRDGEDRIVADMVELTGQNGRYGCRCISVPQRWISMGAPGMIRTAWRTKGATAPVLG